MAIAFVAAAQLGNTGGSLTAAYTVAGNYLFVAVTAVGSGGADTVTGATYNGVAMTLLGKIEGANWNYLFGLLNPATGSHNVVVSASSSLLTVVVAADYSGAGSIGAAAAVTNSGTSTATLSTSITTVEDNCWCIMAGEGFNGSAPQSAGAGTTLRAQDPTFGASALYDSNGVVHPAGSKTLTFQYGGSVANLSAVLASLAPPLVTAIGDLSKTLGADTLSAAGTVAVVGNLSKTLGANSITAHGSVAVAGTLTKTLGADTLSAAGEEFTPGALSKTLGPDTLSALGAVAVVGNLSKTLGAVAITADGQVFISGALSKTLGAVLVSAAGQQLQNDPGEFSVTLGPVTLSAAGTKRFPKPPNNLVQGSTRSDFWQTHDFPEIL